MANKHTKNCSLSRETQVTNTRGYCHVASRMATTLKRLTLSNISKDVEHLEVSYFCSEIGKYSIS